MSTIQRPEKRTLVVRCEHPSTELCDCRRQAAAEILARWATDAPTERPTETPRRQLVVISELPQAVVHAARPPLEIVNDDERYGDGLLGAWACVAISLLLLAALAVRNLWLWIS